MVLNILFYLKIEHTEILLSPNDHQLGAKISFIAWWLPTIFLIFRIEWDLYSLLPSISSLISIKW